MRALYRSRLLAAAGMAVSKPAGSICVMNVARLLAGYLSLQHVRTPEQGCPLPTLTPEVARADEASKAAFQAALLDIHASLQRLTPTAEDAWTLMAQNVGAVMLARAIPDELLQKEILGALRHSCERLLAGRQG